MRLTDEQLTRLQKLFSKYDADKSGDITEDELVLMISDHGDPDNAKAKASKFMETMDKDKSNSISFIEFSKGYEKILEMRASSQQTQDNLDFLNLGKAANSDQNEIARVKGRCEELEQMLEQKTKQLDQLSTQLESLTRQQNSLEADVNQEKQRVRDLTQNISEETDTSKQLRAQLDATREDLSHHEKKFIEMKTQLQEEIQQKTREFSKEHELSQSRLVELENQLRDLSSKLADKTKEADVHGTVSEELQRVQTELEDARKTLESFDAKLRESESNLLAAQKNQSDTRVELEQLKTTQHKLEEEKCELQSLLESKVRELTTALVKQQDAATSLEDLSNQLHRSENDFNDKLAQVTQTLTLEKSSLRSQLDETLAQIKTLEKERDEECSRAEKSLQSERDEVKKISTESKSVAASWSARLEASEEQVAKLRQECDAVTAKLERSHSDSVSNFQLQLQQERDKVTRAEAQLLESNKKRCEELEKDLRTAKEKWAAEKSADSAGWQGKLDSLNKKLKEAECDRAQLTQRATETESKLNERCGELEQQRDVTARDLDSHREQVQSLKQQLQSQGEELKTVRRRLEETSQAAAIQQDFETTAQLATEQLRQMVEKNRQLSQQIDLLTKEKNQPQAPQQASPLQNGHISKKSTQSNDEMERLSSELKQANELLAQREKQLLEYQVAVESTRLQQLSEHPTLQVLRTKLGGLESENSQLLQMLQFTQRDSENEQKMNLHEAMLLNKQLRMKVESLILQLEELVASPFEVSSSLWTDARLWLATAVGTFVGSVVFASGSGGERWL